MEDLSLAQRSELNSAQSTDKSSAEEQGIYSGQSAQSTNINPDQDGHICFKESGSDICIKESGSEMVKLSQKLFSEDEEIMGRTENELISDKRRMERMERTEKMERIKNTSVDNQERRRRIRKVNEEVQGKEKESLGAKERKKRMETKYLNDQERMRRIESKSLNDKERMRRIERKSPDVEERMRSESPDDKERLRSESPDDKERIRSSKNKSPKDKGRMRSKSCKNEEEITFNSGVLYITQSPGETKKPGWNNPFIIYILLFSSFVGIQLVKIKFQLKEMSALLPGPIFLKRGCRETLFPSTLLIRLRFKGCRYAPLFFT